MAAATRPTEKNQRLKAKRAPLLQARTPIAVRRIARGYLAAARRARQRLQVRGDPKALHDFRVALRRLRTTLRLYRPLVDARMVPRKWRRRLKRLARTTNAARDAEVGLAWLRRRHEHMSDAERAACDRLIDHWSARCDKAYAEVRRTLDKAFAPIDAGLRQAFAYPSNHVTAPALARSAGSLMHEQIAELATALHRIASATDARTIHAARVEAKRLRYLLEPLVKEVTHGKTLLKSLKKFQDDFGELCDRQVLTEELIATAAHDAADRSAQELRRIFDDNIAEPTPDSAAIAGVSALAGRLSAERKQRYAEIEQRYLGERVDPFLAPYRTLADTLMNSRRTSGPKRGAAAVKHVPR
jgi:CHAD domain-containing protein